MKLCINCAHHKKMQYVQDDAYCYQPQVVKLSLIDGKPIAGLCSIVRNRGICGIEGDLFLQKITEKKEHDDGCAF